MNILKILRSASALAVLALVPLSAQAGNITTPILFLGASNQLVCVANNVSTSTVTVNVTIVGATTSVTQTCTLHSGDRAGCQAFKNNDAGHCIIAVPSLSSSQVATDLRGVLFTRKTTSPFTLEAVVEAR